MENISFVAAPPGARKTTAALNFIADHIKRGDQGEEPGFLFYVVPTVKLMRQSQENLAKLVSADLFKMHVRLVHSEGIHSQAVSDRIHAILDGKTLHGMHALPFVEGSVIFMTHQGFLGLKDHELFARTSIVFDESRKWVSTVKKLSLPTGADVLFDDLFEQQKFKDSEFSILVPKDIPPNQRASLITNEASGEAYAELSTMHKALAKRCDGNSRVQIFAIKAESKGAVRLTSIEMPSNPFRGFRDVTILSADFETSQMYHLLRYEDIQPANVTERFMNRWLGGKYRDCLQSIECRHSNMTILPLIDSKRMPSKTQHAKGILLPRKHLVSLKSTMEGLDVNTPMLHAVVEYDRKEGKVGYLLNTQGIQLKSALKDYKASLDIIQWMLDQSVEATEQWWKAQGKPANGVAMLNNDAAQAGYVASPQHFHTLSIGEVEGRNEFANSNVVCFLASINPDPIVSRLLNAMLGETGYDADEDYIVDKCIQGIGRGNIRDHNSPAEMLAIVPTIGLAERIKERMKGCPFIDYRVVRSKQMTYWNFNEAVSEEDTEPQSVKNSRRQKEYLKNPLNAELAKLRKLRSKVKNQLAKAATPEKEARYENRLKELAALIAEQTEFRDAFTEF